MRQAGDKAFSRSAYREAVACFEQGLPVLAKLPQTRATVEQAIDLHYQLRRALLTLDEAARGFDHLREAERLARGSDDQLRLGFVLAALCHHYFLISIPTEARRFGLEALEIANVLGNVSLQITVNFFLGQRDRSSRARRRRAGWHSPRSSCNPCSTQSCRAGRGSVTPPSGVLSDSTVSC